MNNKTNTPIVNTEALEPLFASWEEPNKHRTRGEKDRPPEIKNCRRPSLIRLVNPLRALVKEWRELNYPGTSNTSRELLTHWFERSHRVHDISGEKIEFRYYFCQREAIETLIYLFEVRNLRSLSEMVAEYGGSNAEMEALGINPQEDEWARYAFKLATGAGKTKCMSLAIVWSYFHALRESESEMAKHFVIVAPNLTVFERLKEDFRPENGGPDIFRKDPLIPPEWLGDWNFSVALQNEASGARTGGVLYLTNIHRLFPRHSLKDEAAAYDLAGPKVSGSKKDLDSSIDLRDKITSHKRVMLFNDEAHHVWDPGSAWNQAIRWIHQTSCKRNAEGLVAQLDFSATPKDSKGHIFPYVVCDTPLGEAVDAGIIKTPVIGRAGKLVEQVHEDASYRYEAHLLLGYKRWLHSKKEWQKSGKKPLLFVMCENTKDADKITQRLNSDSTFKELNKKVINLHTNLKGRIKRRKVGGQTIEVFEENEKEISNDDLKAIRRISRELDGANNPYSCIVSVLMLREGWDVRNVTTIVPLRPYTSTANILPEQTLGRGLRRMTFPGQTNELVTVVEHSAFASLYEQELEQEGLPIEIYDTDKIPSTTVTIFPDKKKNWNVLGIKYPMLTASHEIIAKLEKLTFKDVKEAFTPFASLSLGDTCTTEVKYEGRHLITNEVVEEMEINLPLLKNGLTAISFYVRELEKICRIRNMHVILAPLLQRFLCETLFGKNISITNLELTTRLADNDVREHIRAVFVPLIQARIIKTKKRSSQGNTISLQDWKPFQVSYSDRNPVLPAKATLFNLVPCNRSLEVGMSKFLDNAKDVAAFAKNAGPQALRIDYLTNEQRLAFYVPDFFVKTKNGSYALIETKGREDENVQNKAKASMEWCKVASNTKGNPQWRYIYVPQSVMERLTGNTLADLSKACAPALEALLSKTAKQPILPFFGLETRNDSEEFFTKKILEKLPSRFKRNVEDALELYRFFEKKEGLANFAPVFSVLLGPFDTSSKIIITKRLENKVPGNATNQKSWFEPNMRYIEPKRAKYYQNMAEKLRRALVYGNIYSAIGLLRSCLDFAVNNKDRIEGVFKCIHSEFNDANSKRMLNRITSVNNFRNEYIAHPEKELNDKSLAKSNLKHWVATLSRLSDWIK